MIDPKAQVSYSQLNEDTILMALFSDVRKGFYVDIGANYPTIDSVTKLFYDKGWLGINVEPIPDLHKRLEKERTRDINLNYAIGKKNEQREFFVNSSIPGHSSFIEKEALYKSSKLQKIKVDVITLEKLLDTYANRKKINFMKIDVEGLEYEVIASNNWSKHRPEVICVECNHSKEDWKKILTSNDYTLFISDGLNEYYIAKESTVRTIRYAERVVDLSYHTLRQHQYQSWKEDSNKLIKLTQLNEDKEKTIQNLLTKNRDMEKRIALSLSGTTYPQRIKRSIKGLTTDWIKYKIKQ